MITLVGLIACAAIYAWYLGEEASDNRTSIEHWTREVNKGEWI
jgi:hypothetical protein